MENVVFLQLENVDKIRFSLQTNKLQYDKTYILAIRYKHVFMKLDLKFQYDKTYILAIRYKHVFMNLDLSSNIRT